MTRRTVKSTASRRGAQSSIPKSSSAQSPSETDADIEANTLSLASLTLNTPLRPLRRKPTPKPKPFLFLSLPSELRFNIYAYYFDDTDAVLDLGPDNYRRMHKRLGIIRTCRRVHDEVTYFFYSTRAFRIFPTYPGRYFKAKKPILARLKPIQRENIEILELRLGPGWNAPPRGWVVSDVLGLKDCINVRKIAVFVECDPSDNAFKGFRRAEGFYEGFSKNLLAGILDLLPLAKVVEFDAYPSVKKSGGMMHGLLDVAAQHERLILWGPKRGWTDNMDEDDGLVSPVPYIEGVPMPEHQLPSVVVMA